MTLLTLPIVLILSFLFTQLSHPLSLGLTLLLQTVLIALTAGLSTYSFWFSYILFIIFLGGILVLFIYVASLASNEIFSFSLITFSSYSFLFIVLTFLFLLLDPLAAPKSSLLPTSAINSHLSTPIVVRWIYNSTSIIFTLFIILYLLLTLIVVVKIVNLFKGPLRLSN